jgi:predicted HicB family RNase H-like nuclease
MTTKLSPENEKKRFNVKIPKESYRRIEKLAEKKGISPGEAISKFLHEGCKQPESKTNSLKL